MVEQYDSQHGNCEPYEQRERWHLPYPEHAENMAEYGGRSMAEQQRQQTPIHQIPRDVLLSFGDGLKDHCRRPPPGGRRLHQPQRVGLLQGWPSLERPTHSSQNWRRTLPTVGLVQVGMDPGVPHERLRSISVGRASRRRRLEWACTHFYQRMHLQEGFGIGICACVMRLGNN